MPLTNEALQIWVILLPGFVSLWVYRYVAPTREFTSLEQVILASILCGADFLFYKITEKILSVFASDNILALRSLLNKDNIFAIKYLCSMTLLYLIAIILGLFLARFVNSKCVSSVLSKLKVKK